MNRNLTRRDEAQLLRALASEVRQRRSFSDALHEVMSGETHDRWINLVAALGVDLRLTPINKYDHDELPHDGRGDHPAAYATRLDIWAARVGDPALVADVVELLAEAEEREFTEPSRVRIGGRAYQAMAGAL